ncbi:MAG: ribosome recycling factor [Clostridiales bacterium]|jgi:ribosome recycling factor|nr:ribosome recycling factor [Clostridiales bacterium]
MNELFKESEAKMKKTVEVIQSELAAVRAGRANPAVLDKIKIDYYGVMTPVSQIGSVSIPEPRTLVIQPWDASALKAVEKAIMSSDLGINPGNDGKVIRLNFPQLTEERRKELIKQIHKTGEDGKVAIRNLRRDANERLKTMKKKSEITEDDLKSMEKDVQDITDKYCKEIDEMVVIKEKELMAV